MSEDRLDRIERLLNTLLQVKVTPPPSTQMKITHRCGHKDVAFWKGDESTEDYRKYWAETRKYIDCTACQDLHYQAMRDFNATYPERSEAHDRAMLKAINDCRLAILGK